ncbi:aminopeptidase P family protein [Desulfobulbus rhabdoformis]|jgi:Xaa-Pro aminopeptidase|uniref:M24 family metallopeptidase n=1 Tax=Desulfobulbus rhabdoformis TaxID=34032 RepID=UPI001966C4E2|nr:Xaa-Pro peptidase family protein [Desulfobulbus rhabdoformis]MBM9616013.1 aminopeptidase P family protein [Desulfobulbus rhabdoformis]
MYAPQQERIERLQKSLRQQKIDGLLVSQPDNRRYLSGYTAPDHGIQETAGYLLIPASGNPILLTDSRFTLQAEAEAPLYTVETYTKGMLQAVETLCHSLEVQTLAFESEYFLYSTFQKLEKMAASRELTLKATSNLIEQFRAIKDPQELELLRRSQALNEKVFQAVYQTIEPGMTEREIALALELTMGEMGAEGPSFETIVAFGTNAAKPHAVPTDRVLEPGDLVLIDMGLILNGYCSDMTRTFVAGKPDQTFIERHRVVRQAMLAGIGAIRAGVTGVEVDRAARQVLNDAGYGDAFGHGLGHGVGIAVHEDPRLSPRGTNTLETGMVVTVEPGLYLADWGGIRLENMVIVQEDGAEVINTDTTSLDL